MSHPSPEACAACPAHNLANLVRLGVDMTDWDYVIALAGNPNVGKSTIFNALTGLRQHTGNWPGKTVEKKDGVFRFNGREVNVIDLPGTYSLTANSSEEVVAREFIIREARLGLNDGPVFGPGGSGFQRMNVACPRSTVEEGMRRLESAINAM